MQTRASSHTPSRLVRGLRHIGQFIYGYFFFAAVLVIKLISGIGQSKFNQEKFFHYIEVKNRAVIDSAEALAGFGSATVSLTQARSIFGLFNPQKHSITTLSEPQLTLLGRVIYYILKPLNIISGLFKSTNFFLFAITFLETVTPLVGKFIAHFYNQSYEDQEDPEYFKSLTTVQISALIFFLASLCSFIAFEQSTADANIKRIASKIEDMVKHCRIDMNKEKLLTLVVMFLSTLPTPMLAYLSTRGTLDAVTSILKTKLPETVAEGLAISSGATAALTNVIVRVPAFYNLLLKPKAKSQAASSQVKLLYAGFLVGQACDFVATASSNTMGAGHGLERLNLTNRVANLTVATVCGLSSASVNAALMLEKARAVFFKSDDEVLPSIEQPYQAIPSLVEPDTDLILPDTTIIEEDVAPNNVRAQLC